MSQSSVVISGDVLRINHQCPVPIPSPDSPACVPAEVPATSSSHVLLLGSLSAAVALLVLAVVVVIVALCCRHCRKRHNRYIVEGS